MGGGGVIRTSATPVIFHSGLHLVCDTLRAMEIKELLEELQKKLERLEELEDALEAFTSMASQAKLKKKYEQEHKPKRVVSPEARAAIGAAQKERWAKVRAQKEKPAA